MRYPRRVISPIRSRFSPRELIVDCKSRFGESPKPTRQRRMLPRTCRFGTLFEQLPQILKHGVFFVRARAIGDKELLARVQRSSVHSRGIKPVPYRSQELISVYLTFSRVPCVTNRSHIELIERY